MTDRRVVPCNGCRQCCYHEEVFIHPELGDDERQYHTRPLINPLTKRMGLALAQNPGGGCVYLGPAGCTIHDRAPAICRNFDCKALYERLAETFGMREIGIVVGRNPVLQVGQRRSKGERP